MLDERRIDDQRGQAIQFFDRIITLPGILVPGIGIDSIVIIAIAIVIGIAAAAAAAAAGE